MKLAAMAIGAVMAVSSAIPAAAADMVTAKDPDSVMDALAELGYRGELGTLNSGRPRIKVQISGSPTTIVFYNCAKDHVDCYTLFFQYGMNLQKGTTLEKANEWNRTEITGRVWLDKNNDPWLDYAVVTDDGISYDTFDQVLRLWDHQIGDAKDFFDF